MPAFDTIVAPITGRHPAPVAVVRLSGPDAWRIAGVVFPSLPEAPEPFRAVYGRFVHGDDGLALPFPAGRSYTGEETAELSVHGSTPSVRALLEACRQAGARDAEPGEFTLRAFLNGRIDLLQAQAVADLVNARTDLQRRFAERQRDGHLSRAAADLRRRLTGALARIEADVDFSEELGPLDREALADELLQIADELVDLARRAATAGRILREGLSVALVGPPNVGKSSLFNAVLRRDRALVTAVPGTTRDTLEEWIELDGLPVRFIDTAGQRETADEVERLGVERSRAAQAAADVLWVVSSAEARQPFEIEPTERQILLRVTNKVDLAPAVEGFGVSAHTGDGLPELLHATRSAVEGLDDESVPFPPSEAPRLAEAAQDAKDAADALRAPIPADLAVVHLRHAVQTVGALAGEGVGPDLLATMFRDFCIGK